MLSSLHHAVSKKFDGCDCFHESISFVLVIAQCFAMLPVIGIKSPPANGLRFKWQSIRAMYSLIVFVLITSYLIFAAAKSFIAGVTFKTFGLCGNCDGLIASFNSS